MFWDLLSWFAYGLAVWLSFAAFAGLRTCFVVLA